MHDSQKLIERKDDPRREDNQSNIRSAYKPKASLCKHLHLQQALDETGISIDTY